MEASEENMITPVETLSLKLEPDGMVAQPPDAMLTANVDTEADKLIKYYKNSVKQQPGYVDENLTWMVREADKQNIKEFGKHGEILFDEMIIQDDLQISKEGDAWKLVGAVDMGGSKQHN
ncbi:hypothetical protein CHS0354_022911 [Potamilus streckersoni]|uniref:Uncharacterized protein n=1 Tax=Potamilus streckersoni TaxID=2493646 RepID=A0AAE0S293_9BIVA|nr:hypothetical protein CHS0354_022911 [Potamilus streckersoni]